MERQIYNPERGWIPAGEESAKKLEDRLKSGEKLSAEEMQIVRDRQAEEKSEDRRQMEIRRGNIELDRGRKDKIELGNYK